VGGGEGSTSVGCKKASSKNNATHSSTDAPASTLKKRRFTPAFYHRLGYLLSESESYFSQDGIWHNPSRHMRIKPIKNERDYRRVLKEIETLMEAKANTAEGDRLDVLVTLADAWEAERKCHCQIALRK
jgi:hypothetical protein